MHELSPIPALFGVEVAPSFVFFNTERWPGGLSFLNFFLLYLRF